MATTNNFNFTEYNKLMTQANSGLKLFLAQQLLQEVQGVMVQYKNPLAKEIEDAVTEIEYVRAEGKKQAAKRANSGNTEAIDNPVSNVSTSADAGAIA